MSLLNGLHRASLQAILLYPQKEMPTADRVLTASDVSGGAKWIAYVCAYSIAAVVHAREVYIIVTSHWLGQNLSRTRHYLPATCTTLFTSKSTVKSSGALAGEPAARRQVSGGYMILLDSKSKGGPNLNSHTTHCWCAARVESFDPISRFFT